MVQTAAKGWFKSHAQPLNFSSSFEIFDCFFGPGRSANCSITGEEAPERSPWCTPSP